MLKRLTEKVVEQSTPRSSEEVKKEAVENVGATATSTVKEVVPTEQALITTRSRMICGTNKITTPADLKTMKVVDADEGIDDAEPETKERTPLINSKKKKKHKTDVLASLPPVRVATTFGPEPAKTLDPSASLQLAHYQPNQRSLGYACAQSLREKTDKVYGLLTNVRGGCDFTTNVVEIMKVLNEIHENLTKNRRALVNYSDEKYSGKFDAVRLDDLLDLMKSLYRRNENGETKVNLGAHEDALDTIVKRCSDAVFKIASSA